MYNGIRLPSNNRVLKQVLKDDDGSVQTTFTPTSKKTKEIQWFHDGTAEGHLMITWMTYHAIFLGQPEIEAKTGIHE